MEIGIINGVVTAEMTMSTAMRNGSGNNNVDNLTVTTSGGDINGAGDN